MALHGQKWKGFALAALAAAAYGTNPIFAVPLYGHGMSVNSVLLFRYLLGLPIIAAMIFYRKRNLRLTAAQILPVAILGLLMGASSLTLFASYNYMNVGIASTLLFMYPVLVAMIMIIFYHERFSIVTAICLLLMGAGLYLLMHTDDGATVSWQGVLLVFLSALTYAIFIVMTNVCKRVKEVPTLKLMFYELAFGSLIFITPILAGEPLTMPTVVADWAGVFALALMPTVISFTSITLAIQYIGPTPTAIFGALEPVTAVVLSMLILGQSLTPSEALGGLLIVLATSLVVVGDKVTPYILRVRRMFPSLQHRR